MFRTLGEILKNDLFKNTEVLAGKDGLSRKVKRVSVFDCPYKDDILDDKIIDEGDLFISCLEQFRYDCKEIDALINALISGRCSGLFVVNDDCVDVINEQIIEKCNRNNFPVILLRKNIPYAYIMNVINKYITIDNINAVNALKIDKILYGHDNNNEKMEILYSMNPNVEQTLRVIYADGKYDSQISQTEFYTEFLNRKQDIYIRDNNYEIFILSGADVKNVKRNSDVVAARIGQLIKNAVIGFSRIYNRKDIAKALEEGKSALKTAKVLHMTKQEYNPLLVLQLLLCTKDTEEAYDFYDSYVNMISERVSSENLKEILKTIEVYVSNSGNYSKTAKIMNQHENTIRYRVNKVKSALEMDDDNIKFNETIAIAVKLRTLIGRKL